MERPPPLTANLFLCLTTFIVNIFCFIFSLNIPSFCLRLLPHVPLLEALLKSLSPSKLSHLISSGKATAPHSSLIPSHYVAATAARAQISICYTTSAPSFPLNLQLVPCRAAKSWIFTAWSLEMCNWPGTFPSPFQSCHMECGCRGEPRAWQVQRFCVSPW